MPEKIKDPLSPLGLDIIFQKYKVESGIVMVDQTLYVETDKLKPHPQNELIYGNEDVADLANQIQAVQKILDPLKIKEDYTIISGHRRWKAAQQLGMKEVPCVVVRFDSDEEELAALVLYNHSREKTIQQRIREGIVLEKTVMEENFQRKLNALKQNQTDMDLKSISVDTENGLTRDKVAEAIQIGSGKTYERGKKVIFQADQYKKEGKIENAELLIAVLNRAPTAAYNLLKVDLESLSSKDKEKIKTGKIPPRKFVSQEKPSKPLSSKQAFEKSMKEIDKIKQAVDELKKTAILVTKDVEINKICKSLVAADITLTSLAKKLSPI